MKLENTPKWKQKQFAVEFTVASPIWTCLFLFMIIRYAITDTNEFLLADTENVVEIVIDKIFALPLKTRYTALILSLFICCALFKLSITLLCLYVALMWFFRIGFK